MCPGCRGWILQFIWIGTWTEEKDEVDLDSDEWLAGIIADVGLAQDVQLKFDPNSVTAINAP